MKPSKEKTLPIIMNALREDVHTGDTTSLLLFEKDINVIANIIAKEECILVGMDICKWIFNTVDEKIVFRPFREDGIKVKKEKTIASLKGPIRSILTGERTVLNFLGKLSGVATFTSKFVKKAGSKKVKILDTRKTTPGFRELEKYAVRLGGGENHRMGLWDGILIKDNHITGLVLSTRTSRISAIKDSIVKAKNRGYKNIEVEVNNLKEYKQALDAEADIIMLDNMKPDEIKKAVKMRSSEKSKALLEISGGINLNNISEVSKLGVDRISIGALTHSAPSIDFSLEICK